MSETKTVGRPASKKTASKKTASKRPSIKVSNTEIVIGSTYEIIGKIDRDAPLGMQAFNTTKYLFEGNAENRGISYDDNRRRWDTGFEVTSSCNYNIPQIEKEALIKLYVEYIKEPYEEFIGKKISEVDDDFWREYTYGIWTGKQFDTSRPDDLFDLFHALKQGKVCEPGERDPILQRDANYCIRNREKLISLKEERANDKAEAIFTFMTMLNALDPKKDDSLYSVLEWIQVSSVRDTDAETLKRSVLKIFENEKTGYDYAKRFLEAVQMTKSKDGKEEMDIFSMLNKLNIKRKLEFKRQQYYLEDQLLGNHLKGACKAALKSPEIKELIITNFERHCS